MASGRMLRAQISLSPQVNDLSLKAALLFTWIIPHVDDFGRIHANPRRLKALVVPMRDDINSSEIESLLFEMATQGLIILYTLENEKYLQLTKFDQHQQGLHKRTQSKLPPPEASKILDSRKFREIPGNSLQNRTGTEQEQEGKGREVLEFPEGNSLSGNPDIAPLSEKKSNQNLEVKKQALEVLNFLNEVTGKRFRSSDTNLKFIIARLKSGATAAQCHQIIAKQRRKWIGDAKMCDYLRPATLFNATKFEQYLGELGCG